MSSYDGDRLHFNRPLSTIVANYTNHELVADAIMPVALVDNKSDSYFKLPEENELRDIGDLAVGATGKVAEMESEVTDDTFKCVGRSLIGVVPGEHEQNADLPLDLRAITGRNVMSRLMLQREIRVANLVQTSGTYPSSNVLSVTDKWDDVTKNPLIAIETYMQRVYPAPDTQRVFWCGQETFSALLLNPFVIDRLKYTGTSDDPAKANEMGLARLLGVSRVVVGKAFRITSNPASGTAKVRSRVWGKNAGIVAIPNYPSTQSIGFGLTFRWNVDQSVGGISAFQGFDAKDGSLGSHWHKITHFDAEEIVASEAGVLFSAAVT